MGFLCWHYSLCVLSSVVENERVFNDCLLSCGSALLVQLTDFIATLDH